MPVRKLRLRGFPVDFQAIHLFRKKIQNYIPTLFQIQGYGNVSADGGLQVGGQVKVKTVFEILYRGGPVEGEFT